MGQRTNPLLRERAAREAEGWARYLSRYTHRVAISNSRLIRANATSMTFKVNMARRPMTRWARILAYVTGTVDQELLARNEYLAAENGILKAQLKGRLKLSDAERAKLGAIGHGLGRKVLGEVATVARPDTILAWYRKLTHTSLGKDAPYPASDRTFRRSCCSTVSPNRSWDC
jgi:hypothetical protein